MFDENYISSENILHFFRFVTTISSLINKCVQGNLPQPHATRFSKSKFNVFQIESTAVVKSKAGILPNYERGALKKLVLNIGPSTKDNLNFSNLPNDLNSTKMINAHEQSIVRAKGTRLLTNSKQSAKLDRISDSDLIGKLITKSAVKKEQSAENVAVKAAKVFLPFDISINSLM